MVVRWFTGHTFVDITHIAIRTELDTTRPLWYYLVVGGSNG